MGPNVALVGVAFACLGMAAETAHAFELPQWLTIETHDARDVQVFKEAVSEFPSASLESMLNSDFKLFSSEPGIEGAWAFFGFDESLKPKSAIRLHLPKNAPYRVRAELYCDGATCGRLRSLLASLPAPLVYGNPALQQSWRKVVSNEACDPLRPPSRPKFVYPREELRREIEGTVVASVFHNRCGDVREVDITTSSGNRNLDRMARKQLLRSRVAPAKANTAGWKQETFEFRLDNPENPPRPVPIDVPAI